MIERRPPCGACRRATPSFARTAESRGHDDLNNANLQRLRCQADRDGDVGLADLAGL